MTSTARQHPPLGATAASGGDQAPSARRWWILSVVGLAQLMVVLDATIVNIALPSAQQDLGFSDADRQWIVTAYSLAFGGLLLLGGRLADLVGRRLVFLIGVAGFAAASALAGAAADFPLLVGGRALQGLFGALLAPAALSLLNTTFTDARERAKAFGVYGAIAGAGGALGLLLGGVLTEHLSWRWTLYVNLGFAALALVGGGVLLRRTPRSRTVGLDLPGALLVSAGVLGIVYGLSNAESHGWSSPMTWGCLLAGALLVAAFAGWQFRAAHPLLPPRIVLDRDRGASFAAVMIAAVGMFGIFLFLTYYLQATLGYSPVRTGLAFLPMIGALVVSAQVATNLTVPRVGAGVAVPTGMAVAAAGMVWLTGIGVDGGYTAHILPPLIVVGLGLGHVMPPAISQATARVDAADAGAASATVNTMQQIGGSIGTALLNTLATGAATRYLADRARTPQNLAQAQLHSYTTAFWWSAGILTLGLVLTAGLYRRRTDGPGEAAPDTAGTVVHL